MPATFLKVMSRPAVVFVMLHVALRGIRIQLNPGASPAMSLVST